MQNNQAREARGLWHSWSSLGLRWRLVGTMAVLTLLLSAGITITLLGIGSLVLSDLSQTTQDLSANIQRQQQQSLDNVKKSEVVAATRSLMTKGENISRLFAKMAATPFASFDTEQLHEQCRLMTSEPEIVLSYAISDKGSILTGEVNDTSPIVKNLPESVRKDPTAAVEALRSRITRQDDRIKADPYDLANDSAHDIFEFSTTLGNVGKTVLLISKADILAQKAKIEQDFTTLENNTAAGFVDFKNKLEENKSTGTSRAIRTVTLLALGGFLGTVLLLAFIANTIILPIHTAVRAARSVADGDLTESITATSTDETGQLLQAIQSMTSSLNSLVTRVKHSSIQLVSTATGIAANVKQQQVTVNDFGSSTTQIAAAVKEISATSKELLQTMNDVTTVASGTAGLADMGRGSLQEMESTIGQLGKATVSISSKLSAIREKADEINVVVTTITKVADQTNLLSLNAAIEAEKAGEYGLGFAVVAREIRRLADQTAVATLDIEQMVKEMQSAVSAGVMEMDRFSQDVKRGVEEVARIGTQQSQIIEQVQALLPRFKSVNEGMHSQSQGAEQISDAMIQLSDGARRTAATLEEFTRASENLHSAVKGLNDEIARFKVAA